MKNKTILITGGGRGIGKAIALRCAESGARVCVSARSKAEIAETAREIHARFKTQALALACDVSDEAAVRELVRATEAELGPIYGLVCAAGIYGPIGPFETLPIGEWKKAVETNLFGAAYAVHAAVPGMKARREGRIVLLSGGGVAAMPNFSAYVTSKGGIVRFNETLAAELAPHNVFVNAMAPGAVNTKFLDDLLAAGPEKVGRDFYERALKQKAQGGVPAEKGADLVEWLLSPASAGLYGKFISAPWDAYRSWTDLEQVSRSDLYSMRRVVHADGGTKV